MRTSRSAKFIKQAVRFEGIESAEPIDAELADVDVNDQQKVLGSSVAEE